MLVFWCWATHHQNSAPSFSIILSVQDKPLPCHDNFDFNCYQVSNYFVKIFKKSTKSLQCENIGGKASELAILTLN